MVLLRLLLAAALTCSAGAPTSGWRETLTPHFVVRHEAVWLPPGLTMGAERIHSRLRMDLGAFTPWMAQQKVTLYVYATQESYVAGEFSPPPWSNGLAIYGKRAVALPAMANGRKQLQVLAHEMTHLLFDEYWKGARQRPPGWINEGLAMIQEADSPEKPETSIWYQQMAFYEPARFQPLAELFATEPKDLHDNKDKVTDWYVQSYAVTYFLLRKHSRLQFKAFCEKLKEGKPAAEALRLAYQYRTVGDLEKRWRAWAAEPTHKRRVLALPKGTLEGKDDASSARLGTTSFKAFKLNEPGR